MENHIIKSILCLMFAMPFIASAHTSIRNLSGKSEIALTPKLIEEHCSSDSFHIQEFELCRKQKASGRNPEDNQYAHAVLSESGTLASVLGDRIFEIDSISVEGPINEADFNTLWESSFNGRLKIINLEKAAVENGIVPEEALFHKDEQVNWETMEITTIWLEKLFLPEGVTEIGDFAVAYATTLHEIRFPNTLQTIGKSAFTDCIRLTAEHGSFI